MKRRKMLKQVAALGALGLSFDHRLNFMDTIKKRKIPSSGENLPVVGLGTWRSLPEPRVYCGDVVVITM